jgi:hypothetical protein
MSDKIKFKKIIKSLKEDLRCSSVEKPVIPATLGGKDGKITV